MQSAMQVDIACAHCQTSRIGKNLIPQHRQCNLHHCDLRRAGTVWSTVVHLWSAPGPLISDNLLRPAHREASFTTLRRQPHLLHSAFGGLCTLSRGPWLCSPTHDMRRGP